jgi:hypothetical protein
MVQMGSSGSGTAVRNAQALALVFASALLLAAPVVACTGDCDGSGSVTVAELTQGVNIVLGQKPMSECPEFDSSSDTAVTIDELIGGVKAALDGCPEPVISTIAGSGIAGLNADGQSPLATQFPPQDITVGPDGATIVDWNNHRIRRIKNGVVETFAGSGYIGDGMSDDPAAIDFNHPTNVCFDHAGNMIVAAWHNSLVKKIEMLPDGSPGEVTNLAGTGARAFGGDEGPGNMARLDLPSSVVVNTNGDIIISDQANYRLRLLEPSGIIHTLAGNGTPGDLGDGGPATLAELNGPRDSRLRRPVASRSMRTTAFMSLIPATTRSA